MKRLAYWLIDYIYLLRGQSHSFIYRKPPSHYLGHIVKSKNPIIFIPGLLEKWSVFTKFANKISLLGHPVYILSELGYNTKDVLVTAEIVQKLIQEKDLRNVVIIAHSKGGLIGKFVLAHLDKENRVKKLIAIAAPFAGTSLVKHIPIKHFKHLETAGEVIADLESHSEVNKKIISIYPIFDNHVWPQSSSVLKGATNIEVPVRGHHKVLFSKEVEDIILKLIGEK